MIEQYSSEEKKLRKMIKNSDSSVKKKLGIKKGKIYTYSTGVLYHGDCFNLLGKIKNDSIDTIFADPPFNLKKKYGSKASDDLKEKEYLIWSYKWIDECVRVLKPGGSLFIYNIPKWATYYAGYLNDRMLFRHWIALTMKNTYPRGNTLYPAHYALLYYTKGLPKTFHKLRVEIPKCRHCKKELKDYGGHRNKLNPLGLNLTDFWEDTSPVRHAKFKSRVANELKPIIPQRAIEMSSNESDIVLDPFGGGGSTFSVAIKTKRYWIGTEINTHDAIINRLWYEFGIEPINEVDGKIKKIFKK